MRITTIPASELSAELIQTWLDLRQADKNLDSPYFHPEFTRAVASVRDDVEIAILEQDQHPVGFFPFQRNRFNIGLPVGGRLSDFHGVVLKGGVEVDAISLIKACRLSAWHFDHLVDNQAAFQDMQWMQVSSPFIDTSQGFDVYYTTRKQAGNHTLPQMLKKHRKLEREVGPVRLVIDCQEERVFQALLRWKAQQYEKSNMVNLFSFSWTEQLLRRLWEQRNDGCRGLLSALYVNDDLIAAQYCLRAGRVLHSWFPAYSTEMHKHSPGGQLLIHIIRAAQEYGIDRIDLGTGGEPYKTSYMTGASSVAEGSVDLRFVQRNVRRAWNYAQHRIRNSPLRRPASVPWQYIRALRDQWQFR